MDNNQMQGGGPGRPQGPGGQKQPDNGRNKNNGKKQGGGKSILVFLVITLIVMLVLQFLFPTRDELLKKAQEAEKNYFLLSAGSLNHDKICSAAYRAGKLYSQLEDEEKVKMFNYILMTDKCL